jgi:hypothetical protein
MKSWLKALLILPLLIGLSSCVEIIDDLSMNLDGSGTFKYTVNLSSSKSKINTILNLDSLDGKKVPKMPEIKAKVAEFTTLIAKQPGISAIKVEPNYVDYIIKFQCNFTNVLALQEALKNVITTLAIDKKGSVDYAYNWISWSSTKLQRSIPEISLQKVSEIKQSELDLLKTGSYTTISRFQKPVEKTDNPNATISTSRMAVMLKANAYSLTKNPKILENTIYLNQK